MSDLLEVASMVDVIKEKISNKEYKDIVECLMKVHNNTYKCCLLEFIIPIVEDSIDDVNGQEYALGVQKISIPFIIKEQGSLCLDSFREYKLINLNGLKMILGQDNVKYVKDILSKISDQKTEEEVFFIDSLFLKISFETNNED